MHEPSPEAIRGGCPCGLWSPRNCAYTKAVGLCNPARNRAPGRPPRRDDEVRAEPAARPAVAAAVMADLGAAITEFVTEVRLRDALRTHHPIMRSETGPFSGCRCGGVKLGQDVIAHVVTELRAALGGEG